MSWIVLTAATLGHVSICVYVINRIHSTGLPHRLVKGIDFVWYAVLFLFPLSLLRQILDGQDVLVSAAPYYLPVTLVLAPVTVVRWWIRKQTLKDTVLLESNHTQSVDAVQRLGKIPSGSWQTSFASRLPGNEVFDLDVREKRIRLPGLDPRLDGLRITHLSDLHLTGRITEDFYHLVVDLANDWPADFVIISGDIIDKRRCFDWLGRVFGRLETRIASCFVLGNHDLRIHDEAGLRAELTDCGLVDLGKRWQRFSVGESQVLLAGNELPWFQPAADLTNAPESQLRIAVSHSPDQIEWARKHGFDLMLAGHTHGGQIRFPMIGPLFSPSRYGIRFSAGTFYQKPTLMHVSRGLSGTRPLRWNCAPELARLVLQAEQASDLPETG